MTRLDDFYRDVISGSEELVYRTTSEQNSAPWGSFFCSFPLPPSSWYATSQSQRLEAVVMIHLVKFFAKRRREESVSKIKSLLALAFRDLTITFTNNYLYIFKFLGR